MKFHASEHAISRLYERNIDVETAKDVIRKPSKVTSTAEGKTKSTKILEDGRILTIIHANYYNKVIIITGYYEN